MPQTPPDHANAQLRAIVHRAAEAVVRVTGDASTEEVRSLRGFDPGTAQQPAFDAYLRLRDAEHSLGRKHPALGRMLRRLGRRVEQLA